MEKAQNSKKLSVVNLDDYGIEQSSKNPPKDVEYLYDSIINDSFFIIKFGKYYKIGFSKSNVPVISECYDDKSTHPIISLSYNVHALFFVRKNGESYITNGSEKGVEGLVDMSTIQLEHYNSFTLQSNSKITTVINKKYIKKIVCGELFALFLSHAGMVYSYGSNTYGELGLGENIKNVKEPTVINGLLNYRINDISCGYRHSICYGIVREQAKIGADKDKKDEKDSKNFLFVWGDNTYCQVAAGNKNKKFYVPTLVYEDDLGNITQVSCGLIHSCVLFESGDCYIFGDNHYLQCNPYTNSYGMSFTKLVLQYLADNPEEKIISCKGTGYSSAVITDKGTGLLFGKISDSVKKYTKNFKLLNFEGKLSDNLNYTLTDEKFVLVSCLGNKKLNEIIEELNEDPVVQKKEKQLATDTTTTSSAKKLNTVKTQNAEKKKEVSTGTAASSTSNTASNNASSTSTNETRTLTKKPSQDIKTINNNSNLTKKPSTSEVNNAIKPKQGTNTSGRYNVDSDNVDSSEPGSLNGSFIKDEKKKDRNINTNIAKIPKPTQLSKPIPTAPSASSSASIKNKENSSVNSNVSTTNNDSSKVKPSEPVIKKTEKKIIEPLVNDIPVSKSSVIESENKIANDKEMTLEQSMEELQSYMDLVGPLESHNPNNYKLNQSISFRPKNLPKKTAQEEEYHRKLVEQNKKLYLNNLKEKRLKEERMKKRQEIKKKKQEELREKWTSYIFPKWYQLKDTEGIKSYFYEGLPNSLRGKIWIMCLGNSFSITQDYYNIEVKKAVEIYLKSHDSKKSENQNSDNPLSAYSDLLSVNKEDSIQKIELDIERTFPYLGIFKSNSPLSEDLREILRAFVASRPDIGYVQGCSFIAGMLLLNMEKFKAYVALMNLILNPVILPVYRIDIGSITTRLQLFKQIFYYNLPNLCSHFEALGLMPIDYFLEWYITLFTKSVNIDIAMRIWDVFMIEGIRAIYSAGIVFLSHFEKKFLEMEYDEILKTLKTINLINFDEDMVIKAMKNVKYQDWVLVEIEKLKDEGIPL